MTRRAPTSSGRPVHRSEARGTVHEPTANTIKLDPYTTASTTASVRFLNNTRLGITVRNLTDEIYIPRSNSDVSGRVAAPRGFELQLTKVF